MQPEHVRAFVLGGFCPFFIAGCALHTFSNSAPHLEVGGVEMLRIPSHSWGGLQTREDLILQGLVLLDGFVMC